MLKPMRIGENVQQEGGSLECTVYIIMKVPDTWKKGIFFYKSEKNICFFNPKVKKLGGPTKHIFLQECKKKMFFNPTREYLRYRIVGKNTFANKYCIKNMYNWTLQVEKMDKKPSVPANFNARHVFI